MQPEHRRRGHKDIRPQRRVGASPAGGSRRILLNHYVLMSPLGIFVKHEF